MDFKPVLLEENNNKPTVTMAPVREEPSSKRARIENSNTNVPLQPQTTSRIKAVAKRRKTNRKMPTARRASSFTPFIFDPKTSTQNYNFSTQRTFIYREQNSYTDL